MVSFLFCQEALNIVRICEEDQERLFATLVAVLWLGNVSFQVIDNGNQVEVLADEGKPNFLGFLIFLVFLLFFFGWEIWILSFQSYMSEYR